MLDLVKAIQSADDAARNMSVADSVALSQAEGNGYIPLDFTESDDQVKCFLPTLCAVLGLEHVLVTEYRKSSDYIKDTKIEFQQALIETCGARQAPAMQSFLFHCLCQGYILEQSRVQTAITL